MKRVFMSGWDIYHGMKKQYRSNSVLFIQKTRERIFSQYQSAQPDDVEFLFKQLRDVKRQEAVQSNLYLPFLISFLTGLLASFCLNILEPYLTTPKTGCKTFIAPILAALFVFISFVVVTCLCFIIIIKIFVNTNIYNDYQMFIVPYEREVIEKRLSQLTKPAPPCTEEKRTPVHPRKVQVHRRGSNFDAYQNTDT